MAAIRSRRGSARPLDFGHWAAHKLESLTRNQLRHGEAVAIGIALDTRYSVLAGLLPAGQRRAGVQPCSSGSASTSGIDVLRRARQRRSPRAARGPARVPRAPGRRVDRHAAGSIGRGIEVHEMDEERVLRRDRLAQATAGRRHEARRPQAAAPHLLHQHSPRRDLGRDPRGPRKYLPRVEAPNFARGGVGGGLRSPTSPPRR